MTVLTSRDFPSLYRGLPAMDSQGHAGEHLSPVHFSGTFSSTERWCEFWLIRTAVLQLKHNSILDAQRSSSFPYVSQLVKGASGEIWKGTGEVPRKPVSAPAASQRALRALCLWKAHSSKEQQGCIATVYAHTCSGIQPSPHHLMWLCRRAEQPEGAVPWGAALQHLAHGASQHSRLRDADDAVQPLGMWDVRVKLCPRKAS